MWALIENGKVIEITNENPDGRYHPDFPWFPAPDNVEVGFTYEGGKYAAPVVEAIERTQFTPREYIQRFTLEEQVAIRQAQFSDMEVGLVYDDFNRAQFIDINNPDVAAGIDLYISKGLLEPSRKAELLQPEEV